MNGLELPQNDSDAVFHEKLRSAICDCGWRSWRLPGPHGIGYGPAHLLRIPTEHFGFAHEKVLNEVKARLPHFLETVLEMEPKAITVIPNGLEVELSVTPEGYEILKTRLDPFGPGSLANHHVAHHQLRHKLAETRQRKSDARFEKNIVPLTDSDPYAGMQLEDGLEDSLNCDPVRPLPPLGKMPEANAAQAAGNALGEDEAKLRTMAHALKEALFDHGQNGWFRVDRHHQPSLPTYRELHSPLRGPYYERALCFDNYPMLKNHVPLIKSALKLLLEELKIDPAKAQLEFRQQRPHGPNIRIDAEAFANAIAPHLGEDSPGTFVSNVSVIGAKRIANQPQHGSGSL